MASLDKTSVRDEVSYLKADFDRLGAEGKLSSESQAIMNMLHMILIFSASRQGQYYNFFASKRFLKQKSSGYLILLKEGDAHKEFFATHNKYCGDIYYFGRTVRILLC